MRLPDALPDQSAQEESLPEDRNLNTKGTQGRDLKGEGQHKLFGAKEGVGLAGLHGWVWERLFWKCFQLIRPVGEPGNEVRTDLNPRSQKTR